MTITAQISIGRDGDEIFKLFKSEKEFESNRVKYSFARKGKGIVFDLEAEDSVALRAALNSITKIITVFEKAKNDNRC